MVNLIKFLILNPLLQINNQVHIFKDKSVEITTNVTSSTTHNYNQYTINFSSANNINEFFNKIKINNKVAIYQSDSQIFLEVDLIDYSESSNLYDKNRCNRYYT